jgi:hypothetical protein
VNCRSLPAITTDLDLQVRKASKSRPATASWLAGQFVVRETLEEASDRDASLEAREVHSCALMRAGGECEMTVRSASDIECIG